MSQNIANETLEQQLINEIKELKRQIRDLKSNQLKILVVPSVAGDPSTLVNGQIWYNTSTGKFRKREGGTTKNLESV